MDNDEPLHFPPSQSPFSHAVRFQIPQFIYSAAPMLAPGGGAEVLPGGIHSQASWVGNNLFPGQKYIPEDQYVFCLAEKNHYFKHSPGMSMLSTRKQE